MALERSTRARLITGLVLFLVLTAGIVLGVALDRQLGAKDLMGLDVRGPDGRPAVDPWGRVFGPRSRNPSQRWDSSHAMDPSRDRSRRGHSLMVEQVGLTEDQKEKVDSIVRYFKPKIHALHDEFNEAYMTRFQEIIEGARKEIRAVLTAEQGAAYDSLVAAWDQRREELQKDSSLVRGGRYR